MNYYLLKVLINDKGQDATSISVLPNFDSAKVNYHQTLSAFINAADVQHAVVEIIDYYGRPVPGFREEVNHPVPEPNEE